MRIWRSARCSRAALGRTILALIASVLIAVPPGSTYRFYSAGEDDWNAAPTAKDALRWKRTVWPPGGTLVWHVVEDPDWQPVFTNASEVSPHIEEALAEWSSIPTADVRMRLDGVVQDEGRRGDGRNTIVADGDVSRASQVLKYDRGSDRWEMVECDVSIAEFAVVEILNPDDGRDGGLRHEFGHCLGLAHSVGAPGTHGWQRIANDIGWQHPIMTFNTMRTADDALGASLLRPAPGWLSSTGSLGGKVTVDGRAAPFVSVHLLRSENGLLRSGSVHVFTNGKGVGAAETDEDGVFRAEGLAPGDYLLWVRPVWIPRRHPRPISRLEVLETDVDDLTIPRLFRVEAGQEIWTGEIALQRGRNPR